ncbi:MAG: alkaline phosphatase family protein [Planctomycetes bacterium]|nr:alkaline phosphatase family protein [Planctomycetota bacterium]MBI3834639.1 alkaline phosphatase family protein [Planctomycetota bacterium]
MSREPWALNLATPHLLKFAALIALVAAVMSIGSCSRKSDQPNVIVLGFDGMDPRLCERLMDAGHMPNFDAMRKKGGYRPLGTSIPPQSPVAWSNFITGADSGEHGIFDFMHRDPKNPGVPVYSAAETKVSEEGWQVGDHRIPLTFWPFMQNPTQTLLTRHGTPFWDYLDAAGIPIRIYDIPSNYPPSPSHHGHMCCLSGMGVPDMMGTYGTYQAFASNAARQIDEGGGIRRPLSFSNNVAQSTLFGPDNTALVNPIRAEVPFEIFRHPTQPWIRVDVQDKTVTLKEGEWSDWIPIDYRLEMPEFMPDTHASAICRFYLQEVRPNFRLYVTPMNINPSDPGDQKISEPTGFVKQISDELGLSYTTGFQEDHKALSNGVFRDEEYLAQAKYVLAERRTLLEYALEHYKNGFLFFYFSSTDLQAHMFWWDGDERHPKRSHADARKYNHEIEKLYVEADAIVGEVVKRYGDKATILVMSDHGFCNFRRQFNLNTWLRDNGYLSPKDCQSVAPTASSSGLDWLQTKAYALGLNGLYINLQGRERDGIVKPADKDALLNEISAKLLSVRDPANGLPIVKEVYRADQVYHGPYAAAGPDLIVGYYRGYRVSWASTLGEITKDVVSDNDSAWSADHCIAADEVPGVIFSNRAIAARPISLMDIAPTILERYKFPKPEFMRGSSIFEGAKTGEPIAGTN